MNRKNFLKVLGASSLLMGIKPVSVLDKLEEGPATQRMPVLFFGHGSSSWPFLSLIIICPSFTRWH